MRWNSGSVMRVSRRSPSWARYLAQFVASANRAKPSPWHGPRALDQSLRSSPKSEHAPQIVPEGFGRRRFRLPRAPRLGGRGRVGQAHGLGQGLRAGRVGRLTAHPAHELAQLAAVADVVEGSCPDRRGRPRRRRPAVAAARRAGRRCGRRRRERRWRLSGPPGGVGDFGRAPFCILAGGDELVLDLPALLQRVGQHRPRRHAGEIGVGRGRCRLGWDVLAGSQAATNRIDAQAKPHARCRKTPLWPCGMLVPLALIGGLATYTGAHRPSLGIPAG